MLLNTWLAKVVNVAYNPPPEVMNQGRVFGAADETRVWELNPLREALEKVVGVEQAVTGAQVLVKLGLSIHRNVVLGYKALNREPVIPVVSTTLLVKLGLSIHRNVVLGYRALNREPVIPVVSNTFSPGVD